MCKDLEFVLLEKKLIQVALHLGQSQLEPAVGEVGVGRLSSGSCLDGTVHSQGEGTNPSLQTGDISHNLADDICERVLQLIF
ncbi:hypothetical protein NQZ68_014128 [Dissostichus eleginoides]|nr:hypothetical protein NQZ68_014128 [Dissostichus eleginoides]